MKRLMEKIVEEHPLSCEFETDARYVWPKRWEELYALLPDLPENNGLADAFHSYPSKCVEFVETIKKLL